MELTELQKFLIACFKAYEMDETDTVGSMLLLKKESMQEEMLEWIKTHTDATIQEVLNQVWKIAFRPPDDNTLPADSGNGIN